MEISLPSLYYQQSLPQMTIVAEQVIVVPQKNSKSCEQESSTTGTSVEREGREGDSCGSAINRAQAVQLCSLFYPCLEG